MQTIHGDASARGFNTTLAALNDYAKVDFLNTPVAIVVTSTTGNGDPPNSAEEFWRFVRKRTHPKDLLTRMRFAMLGLGDTNYDKFCAAAKTIHKRMGELGGTEFYKLGLADESMGLDSVVDPWIKGLWSALREACDASAAATAATHDSAPGAADAAASTALGSAPAAGQQEAAAPIRVPVETPDAALSSSAHAAVGGGGLASPMSVIRAVTAARAQAEAVRQEASRAAMEAAAHDGKPHDSSSGGGSEMAAAVVRSQTSAATTAAIAAAENAVVAHTSGSQADRLEAAAQAAADAAGQALATKSHLLKTHAAAAAILAPLSASSAVAQIPAAAAVAPSAPAAVAPLPAPVESAPVVPAITPGVLTLHQLFPTLQFARAGAESGNSAGTTAAVTVPTWEVSLTGKFMPKLPPATVAAVVLTGEGAAAAASAERPGALSHLSAQPSSAPADAAQQQQPGSPRHLLRASPSTGGFVPTGANGTGSAATALPATGGVMSVCGPGRSLEAPLAVPVTRAHYLTSGGRDSARRVVHLEMSVAGTPLEGSWSPGDAVGIIAPNPQPLVHGLCARLGLEPSARLALAPVVSSGAAAVAGVAAASGSSGAETPLPLAGSSAASPPSACSSSIVPTWLSALHRPGWAPTATDLLTWAVDVTSPPKKALLRLLAEHAADPTERDVLTWLVSRGPGAVEAWAAFVEGQRLHLLDLLCLFPSCRPPLGALLSALPSHAPRFYSLSCSPLSDPRTLTIAFTVVAYELQPQAQQATIDGGCVSPVSQSPTAQSPATGSSGGAALVRYGLATNWLEGLCEPLLASGEAAGIGSPGGPPKSAGLPAVPLSPLPVGDTPLTGGEGSPLHQQLQQAANGAPLPLAEAAAADAAAGLPSPSQAAAQAQRDAVPLSPGQEDARRRLADEDAAAITASSNPSTGTAPPPVVRVFLRPTRDFLPPAASDRPLIMIGPGTGVAPFRGFLQHRRARLAHDSEAAVAVCRGWWRPGVRFGGCSLREDPEFYTPLTLGPAHLFFGNRHPETDFLYRDDLQAALADGSLSALHLAWSRPGEGGEAAPGGGRLYVQHRLVQHGRAIAELLLTGPGAHVYVCGDGARMARDVHAALVDILVTHGKDVAEAATAAASSPCAGGDGTPLSASSAPGSSVPLISSEAQAQEFLAGLAKRARYVRDIWS